MVMTPTRLELAPFVQFAVIRTIDIMLMSANGKGFTRCSYAPVYSVGRSNARAIWERSRAEDFAGAASGSADPGKCGSDRAANRVEGASRRLPVQKRERRSNRSGEHLRSVSRRATRAVPLAAAGFVLGEGHLQVAGTHEQSQSDLAFGTDRSRCGDDSDALRAFHSVLAGQTISSCLKSRKTVNSVQIGHRIGHRKSLKKNTYVFAIKSSVSNGI